MRSFMAAEIPPVACRPPRLLDGRGDDGAGRRPTRWSETERGEDARLSAVIVFSLPPHSPLFRRSDGGTTFDGAE